MDNKIFCIDNCQFNEKISLLMKYEKISPSELSTKTKITKEELEEILKGYKTPNLEEFIAISYALHREWNTEKILHLLDRQLIDNFEKEIKSKLRKTNNNNN